MTCNHFALLLFVGISLQAVLSQLQFDVINSYSNNALDEAPVVQTEEQPGTMEVDAEENGDDEDVIGRIGQAETIEEFMALMRINGRELQPSDIYDDIHDENDKEVIAGGGRLAFADSCSPRNTTIRITMEGTESDVAFFPRCTKIERCGGCCSSPHLECRPMYTERVSLKVLQGRIPFPGASHLEYSGFAPVILDRHMTCRVECTLNRQRCGPKKRFLQQQCMCKCRQHPVCSPPTMWDAEDCSCKCPRVINCCDEGDCSMVFSNRTCECVLQTDGRMIISAGGDGNSSSSETQEQNNAHPVMPNGLPAMIPTLETMPTTATTTTTTASTTTTTATTTPASTTVPQRHDPCATRVCSPMLTKVRVGNLCFCRPPRRRSFGRGISRG